MFNSAKEIKKNSTSLLADVYEACTSKQEINLVRNYLTEQIQEKLSQSKDALTKEWSERKYLTDRCH